MTGGLRTSAQQTAPRQLPRVTLKAAITLDGHMATRAGDSKWITGEPARRHGHRLRAAADAVMVGVGTVLADNPLLTVRHVRGRSPIRVVLDSRLRTPPGSQLVRGAADVTTLIVHGPKAPQARAKRLRAHGVRLHQVRCDKRGRVLVRAALQVLAKQGVWEVLAEGGPALHGALLDAKLIDRVEIFIAPLLLGDAQGKSLVQGRPRRKIVQATEISHVRTRRIGRDMLVSGVLGPDGRLDPERG